MRMLSRRPMIQGFLILVFAIIMAIGIVRDDVRTVVSNATMLCFSCIGLK